DRARAWHLCWGAVPRGYCRHLLPAAVSMRHCLPICHPVSTRAGSEANFTPARYRGRCSRAASTWRQAKSSSATASSLRTSCRKFNRHALWNEAVLIRLSHQPLETQPAAFTISERQIVHVHSHEAIGPRSIQSAPELQRVLDRVGPVRKRVGDAVVEHPR